MTDEAEDFLAHYGVLGMKWGRRKDRSSTFSSDYAKTRKLKQRVKQNKISNLSNAELKKLNERDQLEKKYKDLNPNKLKAGYKYLTGALAVIGTLGAVYTLADNNKAVSAAIKRGSDFLQKSWG